MVRHRTARFGSDNEGRNRMASTGRKENGGFRQLACQSGHSLPRCLMAALDPKRPFAAGRPLGRLTQSSPQLLPSRPESPHWYGSARQ